MNENTTQNFIDAANNIVRTSGEVQKSLRDLTIQMQSIASDLKHVTKDHSELKAIVAKLDSERENHSNKIASIDYKLEQLMSLNDVSNQQAQEVILLQKSVRDLEQDFTDSKNNRKESAWHIVRGLMMPIAVLLFAAWLSYTNSGG